MMLMYISLEIYDNSYIHVSGITLSKNGTFKESGVLCLTKSVVEAQHLSLCNSLLF